jgi:short-subunit dehydrogenase
MLNPSMSVLLTGASGGIGQALARALLARGARVLLVARSAGPLTRLAADLAGESSADRVAALPADVTQPRDRALLAAAAAERGIDVLINNAGAPCFGEFDALPETEIAQVLATNLLAPMLLTRALLPHLQARPRASVLNIGSTLGRLGLPGYAVYSASKFGLRGFSEALRRELAGSGVRVQYLAPRATHTAFNDARVEAYNRATQTRADAPETVAAAALRLLADGAPERFLGFPESLAVRINGLVPVWLDRAFGRHSAALKQTRRLQSA